MFGRWLRLAARRIGIHLRFGGVVCAEAVQSIEMQPDGRAKVLARRTLIFLEPPSSGDLHDSYALGPDEPLNCVIYESPDAVRLTGDEPQRGRMSVYWRPREAVRLYALYVHENGWMPSTSFDDGAVCIEYECDMHTGVTRFDLSGKSPFEAAALVKRPRWPRAISKERIVRSALRAIEARRELSTSTDSTRITWEVAAPRVGDRYILVAFKRCGVADWERRIEARSFFGRARRLVGASSHP